MLKSIENQTVSSGNTNGPNRSPRGQSAASMHGAEVESLCKKRSSMYQSEVKERLAHDEWAAVMHKIASDQDRKAFEKLFAHFSPKIKSFCMMLRSQHTSPQMADELVQDVMIKVWTKAQYFNSDKASVSTWIFTIARNCRTDYLRKLKRTETPLVADDLWPMAEEEAPFASLEQRRIEKNIHHALTLLPPEQAEALKQIYISGKTHAEVASALGLPLGTVKSRVRLAIAKLRISMGELFADEADAEPADATGSNKAAGAELEP
ncbi:MAG: sigma-70 family RNA polymerase sigma factor [Pseudomonadales bacterium]|nr:sigma-70 family RNA polymerase sigma factor [Pseudomonadales bacterium]